MTTSKQRLRKQRRINQREELIALLLLLKFNQTTQIDGISLFTKLSLPNEGLVYFPGTDGMDRIIILINKKTCKLNHWQGPYKGYKKMHFVQATKYIKTTFMQGDHSG